MPDAARLRVVVVYAEPDRVFRVGVVLAPGATVADALASARLRESCPGVQVDPARIGIFGKRVALDAALRDGDRVEIYRPLKIDPKDARRRRANRR
jgi:putative ubiquitin-RnfH superfamily antitoxin RatB of RatAB toxin-antitoxin module